MAQLCGALGGIETAVEELLRLPDRWTWRPTIAREDLVIGGTDHSP